MSRELSNEQKVIFSSQDDDSESEEAVENNKPADRPKVAVFNGGYVNSAIELEDGLKPDGVILRGNPTKDRQAVTSQTRL